jgi:hypothetical protein
VGLCVPFVSFVDAGVVDFFAGGALLFYSISISILYTGDGSSQFFVHDFSNAGVTSFGLKSILCDLFLCVDGCLVFYSSSCIDPLLQINFVVCQRLLCPFCTLSGMQLVLVLLLECSFVVLLVVVFVT